MEIKAVYDQTFSKAIRNEAGEVTGHGPTTHHFTFGKVGDPICGGFYIKVGSEMPKEIPISIDDQIVTAKIPGFGITIKVPEKKKFD